MSLTRQHLIDPEICIRCNTCEESCPVDAVTHNDDNYVVDAAKCKYCMSCISPCPTGAIDNWRMVATPYSIDDQFGWDDLPAEVAPDATGEEERAVFRKRTPSRRLFSRKSLPRQYKLP